MIVFTATNKHTRDVYVGTARESVEEEWADLHAQAEQGASGQFFIQLREHGADGFDVDTWAYGESPSEARESMREAREDLGAQPIKSSRSKAVARKPVSEQSDSMKALMAAFQEALTDTDAVDEEDALEGLVSEGPLTEQASAGETPKARTDVAVPSQQKPSVQPDTCSAIESEQAVSSDLTAVKVAVVDDHSDPQDDEVKMMARIEAMKMAQAKLLQDREQSTSSAALNRTQKDASKPVKPAKIASGRTGSAAKEKRIREAIELERERRESSRQVRGRDEYDEMNAVMARIEMRRLATKRSNAEKTKQAAAQKRKLEREKKAAAATPTTESREIARGQPAAAKSSAKARPRVKSTVSDGSVNAKPKTATKTLKLAAGRTGSSAKEKRIKEAIEQEKADRLAKKSAQSATEAAEMAALLTRLDERSKKAEKIKRSR